MKSESLKLEIDAEFEQLGKISFEINSLISDTAGRSGTVRECAAGGAFLAQFYNGIENILKRIVLYFKKPLPQGDAWHVELSRMFSVDNTFGLPVLFDKEEYSDIAEFRRIRHVVRNTYGHELDWARLYPAMKNHLIVFMAFQTKVSAFLLEKGPCQ